MLVKSPLCLLMKRISYYLSWLQVEWRLKLTEMSLPLMLLCLQHKMSLLGARWYLFLITVISIGLVEYNIKQSLCCLFLIFFAWMPSNFLSKRFKIDSLHSGTGAGYNCSSYQAPCHWWKQDKNTRPWCSVCSPGPCSVRNENWSDR